MNEAIQQLLRDLNWIKIDMSYKAPEIMEEFIIDRWYPMIMASVEDVEKAYLKLPEIPS